MADSYHIIDGKVVPYSGGRKCNDTDAWRDATPLELQLQEQLEEYERTISALQNEVERLMWVEEERDTLARENEAMKRCAIRYLGWLGVTHIPLTEALRMDMSDPTMCGDAALTQEDK